MCVCCDAFITLMYAQKHTRLVGSVSFDPWWVVQHDVFPLWGRFISAVWQLLCLTPTRHTQATSSLLLCPLSLIASLSLLSLFYLHLIFFISVQRLCNFVQCVINSTVSTIPQLCIFAFGYKNEPLWILEVQWGPVTLDLLVCCSPSPFPLSLYPIDFHHYK